MVAGERLVDAQGNEVCLFPLEYMMISQLEHQLYAIDFLGWDANGRVYDCPCYAPFSGYVASTVGTGHNMIYWSDNPVRLIDGTLTHVSLLVAHSNTDPPSVGTHFTQGDLFYHTGNYGISTGDHLHMEIAYGHVGWDSSGTHLENPTHLYDCEAVNDTVIIDDEGYFWRIYQGGHTPGDEREIKKKFPWVLYLRKFRTNMR